MDSPAVKEVAITTTPNEAHEQMQPGRVKEAEETPQYDDYEKMQQGGDKDSPV